MTNASKYHPSDGFTLLELAIVLVIIALLVGGVTVGSYLVRSSQLRSVVAEEQKYLQAINSFRDKYMALPGDFAGATALWGAVDPTFATCITTQGTGTQTCDGDGNGRVGYFDYGGGSTSNSYEQFRAWQHLSNAGLIQSYFTGIPNAALASWGYTFGVNVPASKLSTAGWSLADVAASGGYFYATDLIAPNHVLVISGSAPVGNNGAWTKGVIVPSEALAMDAKIDDGGMTTGNLIAVNGCGTLFSTTYDPTITDPTCTLAFKTGF